MRQIVERFIAALLLVVLSPLLIILIVAVKCTSNGPVFYVSSRLGRHGGTFKLYKFRSMKVNSPMIVGDDGKVLTLTTDSRLTVIGKVLRLGFDELPQLFNIVRGEMSFVGPRPDVPWELPRYDCRQRKRLEVLPGLTGLAQVMGGRELNNAQNYELDVRYVERRSTWLDVTILAATLPYVFGGGRQVRRIFSGLISDLNIR